ncbi:unnamed protein product [Clonostachys rosea]|uniref:Amine oxidase n=1 Tax=Bionectria ochroleuca TaxID=29856 RepID=A0ABY6TR71_BIOOC|nr:unnamed protein product [Clonostachys rosea]
MRFKPFQAITIAYIGVTIAAPSPSRDWDVHAGIGFDIGRRSASNLEACPAPKDIPVTAPKKNPFTSLTPSEIHSVATWLLEDKSLGLNLTNSSSPSLSLSDNYIAHIETLKPNKTDVLSYLDGNGTVPRHARIIINHGSGNPPTVSEYFAGPLPISCNTTLQPLDYFYNGPNGPSVLLNGGFIDKVRKAAIDTAVAKAMSQIADITADLIDVVYYGSNDPRSTAAYYVQNPFSTDGTTGVIWTPWRRTGLAPYDQPSDLYVSFDIAGTDPSLYHLRKLVYNLKVYETVEEFRSEWESGKMVKTPAPAKDANFLRKDRRGTIRELEDRLAPTVLTLDKRYKIDKENHYIEYLGWKFYMRYDKDVGIQFYDIKLKDERILYELSLQDAIAQYAGNNPFQAGTAYMDRYFGIGLQAGRLIPGYDCPYHATYLDSNFTNGITALRQPSNVCIFETDIGVPVTRHTDKSYMQSTKGSKLVVRMIATIGNYDYLWDYGFYVDGTITVDAHASGYVQGNYFRPDDEGKWGPRIQETIAGTLHTHVMNFKADFDLIDTANTFVKTDIVVENITQPWFPERGEFEMMRYNITEVATEDDGLLQMPANGQSMFTIVNKNHTNRWGQPRGYRILPGLSNVVLPSKRSPFFKRSVNFAKQPFAVSRQHDTEPGSSAALNQNVPEAPLVDFYEFFNGESLIQEDLVAWINLGMQHYTRSEDIPNTLMSEAHSSIMFAPQNWGTTELTTDLANAVIYNAVANGTATPETNGVKPPSCFPLGLEDTLVGIFESGTIEKPDMPHEG